MIHITIQPVRGFVGHEKSVVIVKSHAGEERLETKRNRNTVMNFLNGLLKNKEFMAAFKYSTLNIWQFYYSYVVADFFYGLELYEVLEGIKARYLGEKFNIHIPADRYKGLTTEMCESLWIDCAINYTDSPSKFKESLKSTIKNSIPYVLFQKLQNYILQKLHEVLSFHWGKRHHKGDILLVTQGFYWTKNKSNRYYDRVLYPLVSLLQARGHTFHGIEYSNNPASFSFRKFIQKKTKDSLKIGWYSFWAYEKKMSPKNIQDSYKIEKSIKRTINSMSKDQTLKKLLTYVLCELHAGLSLKIISYLESASRIIEEINPSSILATYETGPLARAMILRAHQRKIPTFAIQHGMIISNHLDYMHSVVGVQSTTEGFIIPQTTFIWGEYWKDILCSVGKYPSENVFISGNLGISYLQDTNIKSQNKHVLFLYTGFADIELLSEILAEIKKYIQHIPIIVKAHPSVSNTTLQALNSLGIEVAENTCNIHELIQDSYICISEISTAALEMLAISPNGGFVFNPTRLDGWEYLKEFGECYCESKDELIQKINNYVLDSQFRNEMHEATKNKITQYFSATSASEMNNLYSTFEAKGDCEG